MSDCESRNKETAILNISDLTPAQLLEGKQVVKYKWKNNFNIHKDSRKFL